MSRTRSHPLRPGILLLVLTLATTPGCAAIAVYTDYWIHGDGPTGAEKELLLEQSAPYRQRGAGVIVGRAFLQFPDNKQVWSNRGKIRMVPATLFTEKRLDKYVIKKDQFPPEIEAQVKWVTRADTKGVFEFRELPPGKYIIASEIAYVSDSNKAKVAIAWSEVELGEGERKQTFVSRSLK